MPKRLKMESNEMYNGIYEYTEKSALTGWNHYENEHATENVYRINIWTGLVNACLVRIYAFRLFRCL